MRMAIASCGSKSGWHNMLPTELQAENDARRQARSKLIRLLAERLVREALTQVEEKHEARTTRRAICPVQHR